MKYFNEFIAALICIACAAMFGAQIALHLTN